MRISKRWREHQTPPARPRLELGIAATALGEWALARQAWDAFGVDVPDGEGPIVADFGVAAIGLNPSPRFHEPELLLDGVRYADEVVLARTAVPGNRPNRGPCRFRSRDTGSATSSCTTASRVGAGDVRRPDDADLQRDHAARAVGVPHSRRDRAERRGGGLRELTDLVKTAGFGADVWTTKVEAGERDLAQTELVTIGIGAPIDQATRLLAKWAVGGDDRDFGQVEQLL